MLESWLKQLDDDMKIDGKEEDPMMQAFLYLYLSQIYLLENRKQDALETVVKGIKHTPTLIELHQTHAKILSKIGDLKKAIDASKEAK